MECWEDCLSLQGKRARHLPDQTVKRRWCGDTRRASDKEVAEAPSSVAVVASRGGASTAILEAFCARLFLQQLPGRCNAATCQCCCRCRARAAECCGSLSQLRQRRDCGQKAWRKQQIVKRRRAPAGLASAHAPELRFARSLPNLRRQAAR